MQVRLFVLSAFVLGQVGCLSSSDTLDIGPLDFFDIPVECSQNYEDMIQTAKFGQVGAEIRNNFNLEECGKSGTRKMALIEPDKMPYIEDHGLRPGRIEDIISFSLQKAEKIKDVEMTIVAEGSSRKDGDGAIYFPAVTNDDSSFRIEEMHIGLTYGGNILFLVVSK